MFPTICTRISRYGIILKRISWKQDKSEISQMDILKTGKKQDISNLNLANQEGNKNIKMFEIENLVLILLRSGCNVYLYVKNGKFHGLVISHVEVGGVGRGPPPTRLQSNSIQENSIIFWKSTCTWLSFKMEMILLVSSKLTFSEYLWCLNFLLWILWPAITKQAEKSDLFWDTAPTRSANFKHPKYFEIVNFEETSNIVSILVKQGKPKKFWGTFRNSKEP